jgi:hypothetical protein
VRRLTRHCGDARGLVIYMSLSGKLGGLRSRGGGQKTSATFFTSATFLGSSKF